MQSPSKLNQYFTKFQEFTHRPWYLPAVALLAMLDVFIWVVPTDFLLIAFVLSRPNRWIPAFIWVSFGSALGALNIGLAFHYFSNFAQSWFGGFENWNRTVEWITQYGSPAVTLCAAGPPPMAVCAGIPALLQMSIPLLFFSAFLGRLLKNSIFCYLGSYAPQVFHKIFPKALRGNRSC